MGALDKLADFILNGLGLLMFWVVINPDERGVLTRFGKFVRVLENDDGQRVPGVGRTGLHWVWPLGIDHVIAPDVMPRTYKLGVQSLTTKDGHAVDINIVLTASIRNVYKAIYEVGDVEHALTDSCVGFIGSYVRGLTLAELATADHNAAIVAACKDQATEYGVKLIKAQVADLTKTRVIRVHTHEPLQFLGLE